MRKSENKSGIIWKVFEHLESLEYADDICLLSNTKEQMQQKINRVDCFGKKIGLKINTNKTKVMAINTNQNTNITLNGENLETVNRFTYLGSVITDKGGTEEDIAVRIGKANQAFRALQTVWNSKTISIKTKMRLFNSNIKTVLLYGCESWKNTKTFTNKLQVFINKCLKKIHKIYYPQIISNKELWNISNEKPIKQLIMERKWRWIGHTLRKDNKSIVKEALEWNPPGKRKVGRPSMTWRRTVLEEAKKGNKTLSELKQLAKNRVRWRSFVATQCSLANEDG